MADDETGVSRTMELAQAILDGAIGATAVGLACGGYAHAALWPASQLFGPTLIAPRKPNELALTFDDGPHPQWTPQLLEILAKHNVRATFFLLGKYASTQRPLVQQIHQAGHLIGNHTWNHPNLALTNQRKTREELHSTTAELQSITGQSVRYFRPPFGARRPDTLRIARELGLVPVTWNAMTTDWSTPTPEPIAARLAAAIHRNTQRGHATNLVLHDGGHLSLAADRGASVAAAAILLDRFRTSFQCVNLNSWER